MAKARVAINGFGRIGRLFFRAAFDAVASFAEVATKAESASQVNFDIVAINDLGNLENLAYLLKYDTVYGRFGKHVEAKNGELIVDGEPVKVFQEKDPAKLPWKDLNIDIAVEATGLFESFERAKVHLTAGAKRVVLTAPAKDEDGEGPPAHAGKTVLMGVNDDALGHTLISSNASCTTNSASPVIQVLSENPGILKAVLGTVHAETATQNLTDGPVRSGNDFRRGRAAGYNIAPSTTGAATAVTRAIPELKGKFDGLAYRVPVLVGSLSDITFVSKRKTTVDEINSILTTAAASPRWKGILAVTTDQLVSSDIIGAPYGAIVDLSLTKVIDGDLVKVLSWYDNEAGYVSTLIKHVQKIAELL